MRTLRQLADTAEPVVTQYSYEPRFFQLATVTDPLQHTWTIGYDGAGRVAQASDPLTHQTTFTTDIQGRITSTTDPLQHTWQVGYTGGDQTSTTNPLGHVWRTFVDSGGRVLSTTDPLGRVTRLVPDQLNQVRRIIDPLGGETAFDYDPNGRVLALTDARTHATTYTYDASDRLATRTDPRQASAGYTYDGNDNLTQMTDRRSQVTGYEYDALDRLTRVTYADTSTVAYVYDAGDRLREIVDSSAGTITRDYDLLDRLTLETTPEGSISYTYDLDGRRETMTVAGQPTVTYAYDDAHRLMSITQGSSVVSMTYDAADRRKTLTLPNGIVTTSEYDDADQLTGLTYTLGEATLGTLTYTYDAVGNRTSVGGTWARTGLPQPVASATYDAANRIETWAGRTFSYDANGNLASDGLTSYLWNAREQLTGLAGAVNASFQYDALARRRAKTVAGTIGFLYDGVNAAQELVGGSPTANLITGGIDEVFQRSDVSTVSVFLADALGSTVALSDSSGAIQTAYTYTPFGGTTVSGAANANSSQFTGREHDGTGLYYYRSRYYSPHLQRFIAEDSFEFAAGDVNLSGYVGNNPLRYRDPSGHVAPLLVLPAAGCLGGAGGAWLGNLWNGRKTTWGDLAGGCAAGSLIGIWAWALGPAIAPAAFGAGSVLAAMGRPAWANTGGGFVNWLRNVSASGRQLTRAEADAIIREAQRLRVDVRLDPPHPGSPWNMPHLNVGSAGQVHLPVPIGYTYPGIPTGNVSRPW